MLADKAKIASLIPHSGDMCLLDEVRACDDSRIVCISHSHHDPANPLRLADGLPALCGIEYAAQAMAVHGGLTGDMAARPRAGLLVGVRDVKCGVPRLDELDDILTIEAEKLMGDGANVIYHFSLQAAGVVILQGRATVVLDAEQGA
jgi:predicted hotdog family 3-hydroxylacyl-ACP dehydratase